MEPTWPPTHSQAQVLCPEQSCARARPWLNHNCNLRHFAMHSGEVPEALKATAHASQMQDIDITSPGTPNATRNGTDSVAVELSQRLSAAAATTTETAEATVAHASTAQHVEPAHHILEENSTANAANDEARVSHLVKSMRDVQERRGASQKRAHELGTHIAQLESDLASAKQQAVAAQEDVQSANDQFAVLNQHCDVWEQELQAILTTLQTVTRRRRTST